ncbi:MAG: TonB-dependent receptor [Bryobacterales bacterium]|nr:TonB-dependent receptor [Bryobacterales bacterium]
MSLTRNILMLVLGATCVQAQNGKGGPAADPAPAAAAATSAATPAVSDAARTTLNLLGRTNTQGGESRRTENVQFNLIDNNALKELNIRLGTTATIVSEMQPQRNYFGSEFGNAGSSVLHVSSLRPAAAIHGNVYWTHSNSVFSARSFFQVGSVQPARENNYGLSVSTPLWRRAFLTVDGTQQKIRGNVNGNVLIPLPEERTVLTADPQVRDVIEGYLSAFPDVRPNRTDIDRRMLNTNAPQRINTDTASFRLDQLRGTKDRFTARHALTNQNVDAFQFVGGQNPDTTIKSQTARLTWSRAFSANTTGDFSAGFDRLRSLLMPEPNAVGPQVQIGTAFTTLGPGSNVPLDRIQNRFRYAGLVSHRHGAHRFVFGGEADRLRFNGREASSNRGNFYFRNDFGRDAITNFRLGIPSRYSTGIGELDRGFRRWETHWFVGDTWQARPNLTLQAGLRWQPMVAPVEVNNRTRVPYNCDCNNLAPTVSFAYRLPQKYGVLRGAYGIHYGELFAITFQQLRWNPPEFQKIEVQAPFLINPLRDAVIDPNGRAAIFDVPRDLKAPYSHQYNFSWEAPVYNGWRVQFGYVGSRTHKLLMLWHLNRARQVPGIPLTTASVTDRRPDARYFDVRPAVNSSRAYFDAARATLVIPEWRGLTVDTSYWFSKAIDTGAAYTNTAAGDDTRQGYSQTEDNVAGDLKGLSVFDQSHAALARVRYALPALAAQGRATRGMLGRWALSAVWLRKSGMPFTVLSGSDGPGFGNVDGVNGDRPHVADPSILGRTINHPDTAPGLLPRSAFRNLAVGDLAGNLGVSTFRRAGFTNVNASLSRTWTLASERVITFRAESINLSNTPQFAAPNSDLSSPSFGAITNTLNDGRTYQFTLQFRW